MINKYKIGIAGYGNLGKGAQSALSRCEDMELKCIFTRRPQDVGLLAPNIKVLNIEDAPSMASELDAVILCGGSATDLAVQGPYFAKYFNTIDTFDTHAKIPEYLQSVESAAKASGHYSLVSIGWDPGIFSLLRLLGEAALPQGDTYTFWGPGVSQGHSDAIRRINGVENAKQYTMPVQGAIDRVKNSEHPVLQTREKHTRLCFVVASEGANKQEIEQQIKTMPNYFADYDTTVNFVSAEEFAQNHSTMAHGGFVLRSGQTADGSEQLTSFELKLGSNPAFTSSIVLAYTRALIQMKKAGFVGAGTIFDVPPKYLLAQTQNEQISRLL